MSATTVEPIPPTLGHRSPPDRAAAAIRRSMACRCAVAMWAVDESGTITGAPDGNPDDLGWCHPDRWIGIAQEVLHTAAGDLPDQITREENRDWFVADLGFGPHLAIPLDPRARCVLHVLDRPGQVPGRIAAQFAVSRHDTCLCAASPARDDGHLAALARVPPPSEELTDLVGQLEHMLAPVFGEVRVGLMAGDDEPSVKSMVQGSLDRDLRFGRFLLAPLTVGGRSAGVLRLSRAGPAFTVAELHHLQELAPSIAITVESSRRLKALSHQRRIEAVLSQEAIAIASGTESRATIGQRLEDLRVLLGASIIALFPVDCDPVVAKAATVSAALERRLVDDARQERQERAIIAGPTDPEDPGSGSVTLLMPARAGRHHIGIVAAHRRGHECFTGAERDGLARMAELIGLAWAWGRYQEHRVALARLEERQRIADDLHDDVAQILFAAQLQLDGILSDAGSDELLSRVALARDFLMRGDGAIRGIITSFSRPLASTLSERLYEVAVAIDEEFTLPVQIEISDAAAETARRVPNAITDTIVRVAREALVNVAKHAGHCRVSLSLDLSGPERLRLQVSDTGRTATKRLKAQSHGLSSLRRHARRHGGWLRVTRGRAGGTVVTLTLPI